MKTFKQFLESAPANVSSGTGIRGFGDVSGTPGGNVSNYTSQNAVTPPVAQQMVDQHVELHNTTDQVGGDITDGNIKKGGNNTNNIDVLKKAKK